MVWPPVIPVVEEFVRGLGLHVPAPAKDSSAGGLSARETEVLRLLAVGRTNHQIAEALLISANTVAKHVTSILTKTGAANRVEAALYAREHGLA